jgi:hypothetical protein
VAIDVHSAGVFGHAPRHAQVVQGEKEQQALLRDYEDKKSSTINKTARRATQFGLEEIVSSHGIKNISLFQKRETGYMFGHPVPLRGAYHDRHERGTGCGGRR